MTAWRGRLAVLTATILAATALAGCDRAAGVPGTVTIGLVTPLTGPYKAIGDDMRAGWQAYLDQHDGRLGGHPIRVVVADEGDGGATARAAADKLVLADRAVAIVGAATAPAVSTLAGPITQARIPFVGVGGRPSTLTDLAYIWHTSFRSVDFGAAVGRRLADTVDGPIYVIGPDYQGGYDQLSGFVDAYTAAGGRLANPDGRPAYTPWPQTDNFAPWLSRLPDNTAAVYAFYAGAPAVAFVKQYRQLAGDVPVYGPGFLTEGAALTALGPAAEGVTTVMPYAPGLDNPTNQAFIDALPDGVVPNLYHVTSYDAARLLDLALAATGPDPTSEKINAAIAGLGDIDSPRGSWRQNPEHHTPVQGWYLRRVTLDGDTPTNTVVADLGRLDN
jgi:branched-chain amino acid transport system substrate-binding protein